MENRPTEKRTKKKKGCRAFFKTTWQAFKCTALNCSRGNKVSPLWPQPDTDPSHLEQVDSQNPDDPRPGPSGSKAATCQDSDDPKSGSSNLEPAAHSDPDDPQPGPSGLEPTPDTDLADPEPAKTGAFFKRTWRALALRFRRSNKVRPLWPQPNKDPSHLKQMDYQQSNDPHPGPSGFKTAACQNSDDPDDPDDPQPGPSIFEAAACQDSDDPDDPQPGPSGLKEAACQDSDDPDDPQPGPSGLKAAACQDSDDPDDPQPGPSVFEAAACQDSDDPDDPQPGPSGLKEAACEDSDDPDDPQPGPSVFEAAACQDSDDPDDPQPGPSGLKEAACQDSDDPDDSDDPQPGPSVFKVAACQDSDDPDDPQPSPSGPKAAACQDSDDPDDPQPSPSGLKAAACQDSDDPDDPQPGPSRFKIDACQGSDDLSDPDDPQPGSSGFEAAACQDSDNPDDPQPGPSGLKPAARQDSDDPDDPQPGPFGLKLTPDTDLVDPEPAKRPFYLLYEVREMLGSGCFGNVFKGTRIYDNQQVAIKFVCKKPSDSFIHVPGSSKPLFKEVALNLLMLKAPRSQHILQMYQWFDEPEVYILILEYPHPCMNLLEFILHNGGHLEEALARGLMFQAVLAVKHCVDRGVYHNDIKLDNILVNTKTLQLKLIDFGCGFLLNSGYEGSKYRDGTYADPATALSLGVILFRMVNGTQIIITDIEDLKFAVNVSKECRDVISQCLRRDRAKRATLEQLLGHEWFQQVDGSGAAQEHRPGPASIGDPSQIHSPSMRTKHRVGEVSAKRRKL